jgi:hypothetical protein
MDNIQNCDSYINIPSSQTYRAYVLILTNINFKNCSKYLHKERKLKGFN